MAVLKEKLTLDPHDHHTLTNRDHSDGDETHIPVYQLEVVHTRLKTDAIFNQQCILLSFTQLSVNAVLVPKWPEWSTNLPALQMSGKGNMLNCLQLNLKQCVHNFEVNIESIFLQPPPYI